MAKWWLHFLLSATRPGPSLGHMIREEDNENWVEYSIQWDYGIG